MLISKQAQSELLPLRIQIRTFSTLAWVNHPFVATCRTATAFINPQMQVKLGKKLVSKIRDKSDAFAFTLRMQMWLMSLQWATCGDQTNSAESFVQKTGARLGKKSYIVMQ